MRSAADADQNRGSHFSRPVSIGVLETGRNAKGTGINRRDRGGIAPRSANRPAPKRSFIEEQFIAWGAHPQDELSSSPSHYEARMGARLVRPISARYMHIN